MFALYEFSLRREIADMTMKYQKLKKITPEDLGVAKQFCLDKETLEMQEQILLKNLNEINENEKNDNSKNKESSNKFDLNKGAIEIDIKEKNLEKNQITTLLALIQDKKKRIPKPGQRDMEDIKVNLDFDDVGRTYIESKGRPIYIPSEESKD